MKRLPLALILIGSLIVATPSQAIAQSEPDALYILAPYYPQGYWWDHTALTINIKAGGNVSPDLVTATYEAIGLWNAAVGSVVQFVDVSGDPRAAAKADVTLNLHAQGGVKIGVAICKSGKQCQVPIWDGDRANENAWLGVPFTYEQMVWLVAHELGHVLGLGHAEPLYGTSDIMGYGDGAGTYPSPVISACNIAAFNYVWAWAVNGENPYPPAEGVFSCA